MISRFFRSQRKAFVHFHALEEVLDEMTLGIKLPIKRLRLRVEGLITFARDRAAAGPMIEEFLAESRTVETFVADQMHATERLQHQPRCGEVMSTATPDSMQDRDGAKLLLCMFCHSLLSLLMIFAGGGYAGKLEAFVHGMGQFFGHGASFGLGIVKKLEDQKGFIVLPRRWVIERSFGWRVKQRRLTRDHEKNPRHHEAFVYLAFIGIMTQLLTALQPAQPFAG